MVKNKDIAELLIAHGANINAKDEYGCKPALGFIMVAKKFRPFLKISTQEKKTSFVSSGRLVRDL